MKNRCLRLLIGMLIPAFFSCGEMKQLTSSADTVDFDMTFTDITATDAVKEMGNGWNLGNTLEATGGETAWGAPVTTYKMLQGVKDCGFDSVRVPIAWYTNGVTSVNKNKGNYKITSAWMNRVDEIVSYVLASDMYCIINIHWDGNWWEDFYSDNEEERETAAEIYSSLWTQIAEHYKDYPEKLIFENANEELKGNSDWQYEVSNVDINQTFVDLIRSSGGNNDRRVLLIAGINTDIDKTCDSRFEMPSDTIENHLMLSVHYYTPWTYCGMWEDADWGSVQWDWGSEEDYALMETQLSKMEKFTSAGVPVVFGEFSACESDTIAPHVKNGWDKFLQNFVDLCRLNGQMCPMVWDIQCAYPWYDRYKCKFNSSYPELYTIFARQ
ncbi:glycoside hydrolase family 5 protein [Treponema sp.]|uniref:glycoside hydrolase family 5 protein n=1 Tax=Treponema sp. TaxID=166 RepID=UPI00257BD61A|nr:glycoside hydrolase family 5 protein [Treponema sp.]MBE6355264.1 glycoside hydrolase family 5 protein [Treponema sp.]